MLKPALISALIVTGFLAMPVYAKDIAQRKRAISPQGIAAIKYREGLHLSAYQDIAGIWTIGYGHTQTARAGMVISESEAEKLLKYDLLSAETAVNSLVKVALTQGQYDALVSFVYNVGAGNFERSTMLEKLNNGDYIGASDEFNRWKMAGGSVVVGLVKRRDSEINQFWS